MAEGARVDRLEVLKDFKAVLWKFQEMAINALGDAESEMRRTMVWLETEQDSYWTLQIRKREDALQAAKNAVRSKKLFHDSSGRPPSTVEEEKALQLASRRLLEAQQKLANVRKWARALQKEVELYKGSVVRLATSVHSDLPAAAAYLDALGTQLEAYVSLQATAADLPGGAAGADSRALGADDFPETLPLAASAVVGTNNGLAFGGNIPSGDQRAAAIPVADLPLIVPALSAEQLEKLGAALGEVGQADHLPGSPALVAGERITALAAVKAAPRILLHHAEPIGEHDSGWCLIPLGGESALATTESAPKAVEWYVVRLGNLLKDRPEWRTLLRLPVGFSVIIGPDGVEAVAGQDGRRLWPPEMPDKSVAALQ